MQLFAVSILVILVLIFASCFIFGTFTGFMYLAGSAIYIKNTNDDSTHYETFFNVGVVMMIIYVISSIILLLASLASIRVLGFKDPFLWTVIIYSIINSFIVIYLGIYTHNSIFTAYNSFSGKRTAMQSIKSEMILFVSIFVIFNVIIFGIMSVAAFYSIKSMNTTINDNEIEFTETTPIRKVKFNSDVNSSVDKKVGYTKLANSQQIYQVRRSLFDEIPDDL